MTLLFAILGILLFLVTASFILVFLFLTGPGTTLDKNQALVTVKLRYLTKTDALDIHQREIKYRGNICPCKPLDVIALLADNSHEHGILAYVEETKTILGHLLFSLREDEVFLISLVIEEHARRCGIGSMMLDWLLNHSPEEYRRPQATFFVRESALPAHQFLKANGFKCQETLPDIFSHPDEAAYGFYLLPPS